MPQPLGPHRLVSLLPALLAWLSLMGLASMSPAVATDASHFSHDDWATVLERSVDARGFVDYDGLAQDRAALDRYLEAVEQQGPTSTPELFPTEEDELAYYLNAYNALVFAGVLERGPERDSVWKGGLISGYRFFVKRKWEVDGKRLSLKRLEDVLIREGFGDPRIHAALNCASISCPRLPQEPFLPATLETQLDAAMTEFVSEERNVEIGRDTVTVSKIFDWFKGDFIDYEKRNGGSGLISYINRYRGEQEKIPSSFEIEFFRYDKGVNAQRRD
ncbi:MAG: DUF547 domain-containing protein [Acidobacteriota bacterium]